MKILCHESLELYGTILSMFRGAQWKRCIQVHAEDKQVLA